MRSNGANVLKHWQHARGYIIDALENSRSDYGANFTPTQIMEMLMTGDAFLFIGKKSAAVCQLLSMASGDKNYIFWLAGGDRAELMDDLIPEAEEHAKELGADRTQYVGRLAWGKHLEAKGYSITKVAYAVKELNKD